MNLMFGDGLPQKIREAFVALGEAQRGEPEAAMVAVQMAAGGGVLQPVVEHVGDLTHRMTHLLKYGDFTCLDAVQEKVATALRQLESEYGFERELQENFRNNADFKGIGTEALADRVS